MASFINIYLIPLCSFHGNLQDLGIYLGQGFKVFLLPFSQQVASMPKIAFP